MEDCKPFVPSSMCRLCLGSTDGQMHLFSTHLSIGALMQRIFEYTGVRLHASETCPNICDVCIAQLVICERFVNVCRDADQKLQRFLPDGDETNTIEHNPTVPSTIDEVTVSENPSRTPKGTSEEFYMVEVVDTNHEYDIDPSSEYVPGQGGSPETKPSSTVGRKMDGKGRKRANKSACTICGTMQQNLKQHMLVHTGEKRHVCPVCQKAFSQKGNLTYHMNQHSRAFPYECDRCVKAFKDPQSLRSHKLVHTTERKFSCDVCQESFKYRNSLAVHLRRHSQDKRFSCSECQRTFMTSSRLKIHSRSHTGERPYPCGECGKFFKSSHNLSSHKLSHTKERRFQCDHCERWFSYKNVLKAHMNVHLGKDDVPTADDGAPSKK